MIKKRKSDTGSRLWVGNHPTTIPPTLVDADTPFAARLVTTVAWDHGHGRERKESFFLANPDGIDWTWFLTSLGRDVSTRARFWAMRASTDMAIPNAEAAARWLFWEVCSWEKRHKNTDLFARVEAGGLLAEAEVWRIGEEMLINGICEAGRT